MQVHYQSPGRNRRGWRDGHGFRHSRAGADRNRDNGIDAGDVIAGR
jgi:hypothetical protein